MRLDPGAVPATLSQVMPARPTPGVPSSASAPVLTKSGRPLASRLARFFAFLLDGVTLGAATALGTYLGSEHIGSLIWFAALLYLMVEHGQSPGKALMGIQIVGGSGRPVGFLRGAVLRNAIVPLLLVGIAVLVMRFAPETAASVDERTAQGLAGAAILLSYLPILGSRRRALHDYLAGTSVVKTS